MKTTHANLTEMSSMEKKISTAASTPNRIEPSKNNTAQASLTEMLRLAKEKNTFTLH
jgi:hypothetical protein